MRYPLFLILIVLATQILGQSNVGIGTTMPLSKLDIAASGSGAEVLRLSTDRPWVFKQLGTGSSTRLALQTTVNYKGFSILSEDGSNTVADFYAANDESIVSLVPQSGRVGIGMTNPSVELEVFSSTGSGGYDTAFISRTVVQTPNEFDQTIAIYGEGTSTSTIAVMGRTTNSSGFGTGVYGISNASAGAGVRGSCYSGGTSSAGVTGYASGQGTGVSGTSSKLGVKGVSTSGSGVTYGVHGSASSTEGIGVYGAGNTGVHGVTSANDGVGVYGANTRATGSTIGIEASVVSVDGTALYAHGGQVALYGTSSLATASAVKGFASSLSGTTNGLYGESASSDGRGVYGFTDGSNAKALYGYATGIYGKGVHVKVTSDHSSANGILSEWGGGNSYAGYFVGRVHVAGNLSKSSGSFKIDHPLDPENKYLYHSFVESPDMMNVYNGNIVTDADGFATIELPEYFEALNKDFRYQLTVIRSFARVMIYEEVSNNKFKIKSDEPNVKVSWQITGVRKDPYAKANPIIPVVDKEPENRGKFLNPEAYGRPETVRIGTSEIVTNN